MKIELNLESLLACVHKMGAQKNTFFYNNDADNDVLNLDKELQKGKAITLDELEYEDGFLSISGLQVLLYIADQGRSVRDVINGEKEGRKVHVADCETLEEMRIKNRFGRYHVTNSRSGIYEIFGTDYPNNEEVTGHAELKICKNCLKFLNYKNYRNFKGHNKSDIYDEFTLTDFFSQYSTMFKSLPKSSGTPVPGYTPDWKERSQAYRRLKDYQCEQCKVDLSGKKFLIDCHHISGNKQDNNHSNLLALCKNCHRKQPMHGQYYVSSKDMRLINSLRRAQGLLEMLDWDKVIQLSDTAITGLLGLYRKYDWPAPDLIGLSINDDSGKLQAYAEIAWSQDKIAIVLDSADSAELNTTGWDLRSIGTELRRFGSE